VVAVTVLLVVIVVVAVVLLITKGTHTSPAPDVDPERAVEVAVELHAIRRRLDVAWARSELRDATSALRRELDEDLRGFDERGSDGRGA